jgi:hypothetical protein
MVILALQEENVNMFFAKKGTVPPNFVHLNAIAWEMIRVYN